MLSAMTTSENFPLINQSRCSPSPPYNTVLQPTYVANILRQNLQMKSKDDCLLKYQLIQEPDLKGSKISSDISYYLTPEKEDTGFSRVGENDKESMDVEAVEEGEENVAGDEGTSPSFTFSKTELESELTELLEQLEVDDSLYEQSKPLKIDPNVLKLDFSKISVGGDFETLEKLYSTGMGEGKRASHHLSGGILLTDASQDGFLSGGDKETTDRLCKLSGGGLLTINGNTFNFDGFNVSSGGVSALLNQISPSSPLTFDLTSHQQQQQQHGAGMGAPSPEVESTNPFRSLLKDESSFSPTNPFSDFCGSSSLNRIPQVECAASPPVQRYENISVQQKSFSQCSTRPTSPVLKNPEESSVSNPFLINDTSPESYPSPVPHFFLKEPNFPEPVTAGRQNPSSFIFAVPVFSILPQQITNSSTQTVDLPEEQRHRHRTREESQKEAGDPVYQNLTNQLEKFVKRNDHSEYDLQCLKRTVKDLRSSGWYYENVSWQESVILLKSTEPGTFLIRDSSDPNFLFSLSVQTSRGPTSVRLHYVNGQFRLDAEEKLIPHMPSFGSVIELIDYYVEKTVKNKSTGKETKCGKVKSGNRKQNVQKSKNQVWIDSQGNVYSNILLVKPLYKKDHFSSLQHLARLTINTHVRRRSNAKVKFNFKVTPVYESSPFQDSSFQSMCDQFCPILSTDALPIPSKLIEYLQDYPYCH
ncbi:hypothetical protein RUM43_004303 [Polyplax serrata]|uniref:Uncharacterized protein n=1 Tax=Polyplax serrata TaxID=468196 RepID=A0AAN8SAX6_POLSC